MTLSLPEDAEPFGTDWSRPGVYVLRYAKPDPLAEAVDEAFDTRPEWFDLLDDAEKVLYVGESGNVMRRLEDHAEAKKRLTTLSRIGAEPIGIVNIRYYDDKRAAELAEYNTAVRTARQTDSDTLVLCNGEPV